MTLDEMRGHVRWLAEYAEQHWSRSRNKSDEMDERRDAILAALDELGEWRDGRRFNVRVKMVRGKPLPPPITRACEEGEHEKCDYDSCFCDCHWSGDDSDDE